MLAPSTLVGEKLATIFEKRGFESGRIVLPKSGEAFPVTKLKNPKITSLASFEGFPEGPSYRPQDGGLFFSGNVGLRHLDPQGKLHTVMEKPSGGGTHFLPDGSVLVVGGKGLRRIYRDGRVALIAEDKKGNDITMGIHGEVYFSVPGEGIYRVTPGKKGKVEKVTAKGGNGLDVDPSGKFLYVHQAGICRYAINGVDGKMGSREQVYTFPKGQGGADGCTFDAWGNLYSVQFKRGVMVVLDPKQKKIIGEIDLPVKPATNVSFYGPKNDDLFVTAGVPRLDNCQVLKVELGITGFCGHAGATEYPVVRMLDEEVNIAGFVGN